ncbi:MAG: ATP-grasp domain-containing protein [Candidatus Zixiibacteriota bacterium]|nr:MAG: ATP-grasp domain-containing protein [candidate division Zixibacteria bacterium]
MGNILVTDGRQRSTLALVRSLGKKGLKVTVGEDVLPCLASSSRYTHDSFRYVSPSEDPDGFMRTLTDKLRQEKYDLLIPMTDVTGYLIGRNQQALSELTKVPIVGREVFEQASDKAEMVHLAKRLGIPVPRTHFVGSITDVEKLAPELEYPVVIKPRRSRYFVESRWITTHVGFAGKPDELIDKFRYHDPALPFPIIQQRVEGPGCGAFFLFNHGHPVAIFFHRRIREKPPSGGVSVLRESIPIDEQMRRDAEKLLSHLNWHGVAMVEFKQDKVDGQYKLMEINARFWGSLQLAIDAGIDFPYLLYQISNGQPMELQEEYKTGVKCRWFFGDLDHLLMRLFKSDRKLNLPEGSPGRLSTLHNFLKLWQADTKYEIFKGNDIRPALHEAREYVKSLIGMSR